MAVTVPQGACQLAMGMLCRAPPLLFVTACLCLPSSNYNSSLHISRKAHSTIVLHTKASGPMRYTQRFEAQPAS